MATSYEPKLEKIQQQGRCRNMSPDIHFGTASETLDERSAREKAAKEICRQCIVVDDCLLYAIQHDINTGIWGAHTPDERQNIFD